MEKTYSETRRYHHFRLERQKLRHTVERISMAFDLRGSEPAIAFRSYHHGPVATLRTEHNLSTLDEVTDFGKERVGHQIRIGWLRDGKALPHVMTFTVQPNDVEIAVTATTSEQLTSAFYLVQAKMRVNESGPRSATQITHAETLEERITAGLPPAKPSRTLEQAIAEKPIGPAAPVVSMPAHTISVSDVEKAATITGKSHVRAAVITAVAVLIAAGIGAPYLVAKFRTQEPSGVVSPVRRLSPDSILMSLDAIPIVRREAAATALYVGHPMVWTGVVQNIVDRTSGLTMFLRAPGGTSTILIASFDTTWRGTLSGIRKNDTASVSGIISRVVVDSERVNLAGARIMPR